MKLNKTHIDYLIPFSENMSKDVSFNKSIPFCQMINIIEMYAKLIRNQGNIDKLDILKTIIYRVTLGLKENRDVNSYYLRNKLQLIFEKSKIPLRQELFLQKNKYPLCFKQINREKVVNSLISNISISSINAKNVGTNNIIFTPSFNEMIETIFLGLASNTPIILEGMPGQGKQTAIKFIADILGYNILNIIISKSTKVDDLLGKLSIYYDDNENVHFEFIKPDLVSTIESEEKADKSIIVFHNINLASSAVLETIQSIFDHNENTICLPDGSIIIKKNKLNLIGINNTQMGLYNRENLPSNLLYSSIYFIVNNPNDEEFEYIIQGLFENKDYKDDTDSFLCCFNIANRFIYDANISTILTLNDVIKYTILREKTFGIIDKDIITQIIFSYRFIDEEIKNEIKKEIAAKDMNFTPSFSYDFNKTFLNIKVKNDDDENNEIQNGLNINLFSNNIDYNEIESDIACLTLPQKHCLLFLACAYKSKLFPIIQGETCSGKTHVIRLFAKMLGQELIVYQMNKDSRISILDGQYI